MTVQELTKDDINNCAGLIMKAYNGPPWNYHWTIPKATLYLSELFDAPRFVGFVIYEGEELVAAMFAHAKTWWINDLLMIEELFVAASKQGRGYGQALINSATEYSKSNGIGSITLLTHKFMPAFAFYEKNKFLSAEQYVLMFNEN